METIDKLYMMYKFTKNPDKILKWLCEHIDDIDLLNHVHRNVCEIATKYLFNEKIGKWTEEEAKFLITFFVKQYTGRYWLEETVNVSFLSDEQYIKKTKRKSPAVYQSGVGAEPCIYCSEKLLLDLIENNQYSLLLGLKNIFHEIIHAIQDAFLRKKVVSYLEEEELYDCEKYMMALEIVASKMDKSFYDKNYSNLLIENDANKKGAIEAGNVIRTYNPIFYERYFKTKVEEMIKIYDKKMIETSEIVIFDKKCERTLENLDAFCTDFIKQYPDIINIFPILGFSYSLDGTKKDVVQLYLERNKALDACLNKENINRLYEFVTNNRKIDAEKETKELLAYISKTKNYDVFLEKLLLYRFHKLNLSQDKMNSILNFVGFSKKNDDTKQTKL